ncbi:hypothetical protein DH2020_020658 [Rehmannia glutinosa]|uniref:Protein kinase domain-containing protein n=1 Tax=Rehmannia glutinosa TaxID=99300 RepID=A0ABR0WKA2_REHGL
MPLTDFFTEYGEANLYEIQEVVGKGSYGVVAAAIDTHTGEKVAIKKINNIFEHVPEATRILREIKLLRLLRHPDIVEIKHIMLPPCRREFKDIYVVFELMETDLHHVIKTNSNVFHRDLKPKNILANADCKLKICDFGLARPSFGDAPSAVFWTDYVATRWYRAPELCGSFFSKIRNEKARRYLSSMRKKSRALADPYFYGLANVEDEPSTQPISKFDFVFERRKLTKDDVRELIYREILEYHPEMLDEYLRGMDQTHFMYPSGVDQFKQQFVRLEEHPGEVGRNPWLRRHVSLPRERVCSLIDEDPDKDSESKKENIRAIPRPRLASTKKAMDIKGSEVTNINVKARQNGHRNTSYSARCLLRSASISASKCVGVEGADYC